MSLHLYFTDEPLPQGVDAIYDVGAFFVGVKLPVTPEFTAVLKEVDKATLSTTSDMRFVDRFGGELYWDSMSTGCKAAYLIRTSGKLVSAVECGDNAIKSMVKHYTEGSMLLSFPQFTMPSGPVDVVVHGKHFTDGEQLDYYLKEECR